MIMQVSANPLLTIICLAYNHEDNIRKTLDGFLAQQTSFGFEIWIHDDASTDYTQSVLKEYRDRYPDKIKLTLQSVNQLSQGIMPLTTYVFPHLTSKYLAFCEGDDFWTDSLKLERQVSVLEADPTLSMCVHDVNLVFESGVQAVPNFYTKPYSGDFEFTFMDELKSPFFSTASLVTRLDLVRKQPKNHVMMISGDLKLFFHLLSHGNGFYINDVMATKRKNPGGVTQSDDYRQKLFEGSYELLLYIKPFAPREARRYIRLAMGEFERFFLSRRTHIKRHSKWQLLIRALIHDPVWWSRKPRFSFWGGFLPHKARVK